ncbi:MAG: efflux RND transporter periplasmic adaptor subunit [Steroidobacteraceae bacterium]
MNDHASRGGCQWRRGILALCLSSFLLTSCARDEAPAPPAPKVNVIQVATASLPLRLEYTARTRGEREVQVRARVSGILMKRFYREGAEVKAGDLLFEIDPQPFAAAVRSAEGRLGVEQARIEEAAQQRKRVKTLSEKGVSADRERDLADAAFASAKAAVDAAAADLERARIDLSYTKVRAPIGGLTGAEVRSEGSLVDANTESSLLTTITQIDRLYVDFAMPEAEARVLRDALAKDDRGISIRVQPARSAELPEPARIEFLDTRVDPGMGTVVVRATLNNTAGALSPGQFVRARVEGLTMASGIYVPSRAVMHGAEGVFVWKLDDKNLAQIQPVALGASHGNLLQIEKGLAANDRVVVDGVLKLAPNAPADATVVPLDAHPVVVTAAAQ